MKKQPAGIKWASKGPVGQNVYLEKTPLNSIGTYFFVSISCLGGKIVLHYILFIYLVK